MCACEVTSVVSNSVWPYDVAHQAPLSMGFSRQEFWSWLPCPPQGDLRKLGIESTPLMSPALAGGLFTPSSTWEACFLEALSVIWMIIMVTEYLMCVLGWHDPCSSLDCCTGKSVYNRGLRSEETASGKPNGWGVLSLTLWLPVSFAKSFSFSFQIFPSKWELSRGDVAVVKAFVSVLLLWLLSSLRSFPWKR